MTVEVFSDLDALPGEITDLISVRRGTSFFRSIEWFTCLLDHGIGTGAPRVYLCRTDDSICVLFCLAQGRQLTSLTNYYTMEFGPAIATGNPGSAGDDSGVAEILSYIDAERPRWTLLDLRKLHDGDLTRIRNAAKQTHFACHSWEQHQNWFLDVDGQSFDQYFAARSSRLRNTIERKSRKAERDHELRFAIYPADEVLLDQAIEHYQVIYATSWKQPEPFPGFMPALLMTCAEHDMARIGLAWVDDEPAAAQFWIRDGDRAFIYKLAYDEKFAELSIGSMLSKRMFQHAIDVDRVVEIDYGVGDEPYKRDWMSGCRSLSGLLACNRRTIAGQLRNLRETLAKFRRP